MIFKWETEKEKLLKYMRMPAKKKMELLNELHKFTFKFSSKNTRKLRQKLREML